MDISEEHMGRADRALRKTRSWVKKIGVLIILFILFKLTVFNVPAGHAGVVFNRLAGGVKPLTYGEGWHTMIPLVESVDVQEVRIRKIETTADSASKDLQDVQTIIALNYHLDRSKVHTIYQNIGWEYDARIVKPAIEEAVKATTALYTAEELITKRSEVSSTIKNLLTERLSTSDIIVDYFSIVNFDFSPAFNNAIEAKQVAEQDALREKRVLDKIKIQAEQRIAEADGIKKSQILKAEGEAQAKLLVAGAEAKAIELQGEALKENPDVIELRRIEKWDGVVPKVNSGALPIINLDDIVN
jgi:regulator of protease activity HflC (stomatin/prohibitin superfamily)